MQNGVPRSGLATDFNNVAPRVGVSWDLTGAARWSLRGGYGLFYDSGTLIENSALYFNPPYFSLQLYFPTATAPIRIEDPFAGSGVPSAPAINTLDPDFHTAFSHHGSLSLERVFSATTLTARYVTTYGRNMVRKRNINQPTPAPGAINHAPADTRLRRHPPARAPVHVELPRAAVGRRAAPHTQPVLPRLLHVVDDRSTTPRRSSPPTATTTRRRTAVISPPSGAPRTSTSAIGCCCRRPRTCRRSVTRRSSSTGR